MRRLGSLGFVLGLAATGAANATVIVTGGGPAVEVSGALQALAVEPIAIDVNDTYQDAQSAPDGNGATPGGSSGFASGGLAEFDGEGTVVQSQGSASYSYQFGHLNGELNAGSVSLSTFTGIGMDASYFEDPPGDGPVPYVVAYGRATAIQFIDLQILDVDYLLDVFGNVQDDNAQIDGILSYFVSVADVTSGFDFLALYQDETPNDFTGTPFSGSFTLEAGRKYRLGIGAATDYLCTSLGPVSCPTENDNGDPVDSDPQPPGFYFQSGASLLEFTLTPVPEPGTALLVASGLALLAARRRS